MENANKAANGQSAITALEALLEFLQAQQCFSEYIKDYRAGHMLYNNQEQFYAAYLIVFQDNTKWAIYSTTSFRSDRFKEQLWDADNLKSLDMSITRAFLVYPDDVSLKEMEAFKKQNEKCINHIGYYSIDAVVPRPYLANLIKEKHRLITTMPATGWADTMDTHNEDYPELSDEPVLNVPLREGIDTSAQNAGNILDARGKAFEALMTAVLSNERNFLRWKTEGRAPSNYYNIYTRAVNCMALDPKQVKKITASCSAADIGRLPSGGMPKTDILVQVELTDGTLIYKTISCKISTQSSVSVHQYPAAAFAKALDPDNAELLELLTIFQNAGSISNMPLGTSAKLTNVLAPYRKQLALWVLGGHYGPGNPETQWANYILTCNDKTLDVHIYPIEKYVDRLLQSDSGSFGTGFSWTYASKQRGKSIQLKCKILE